MGAGNGLGYNFSLRWTGDRGWEQNYAQWRVRVILETVKVGDSFVAASSFTNADGQIPYASRPSPSSAYTRTPIDRRTDPGDVVWNWWDNSNSASLNASARSSRYRPFGFTMPTQAPW